MIEIIAALAAVAAAWLVLEGWATRERSGIALGLLLGGVSAFLFYR